MHAVREIVPADEAGLLALNNAEAAATSPLDASGLRALLGAAFLAVAIGGVGGIEATLIAFDQDAAYASVNFLWFRGRFSRFVYVDRVITQAAARGRGHGRALYQSLFDKARAAGHERITCEVNLMPPNPVSDRFHAGLGFTEIDRAWLPSGKQVRYLGKQGWGAAL